ncbi:MAG TPA: hypothetical protein VGL53_27615 [Bryobacteraceae bacterium]|jgi:hypothetical protein
MLTRRSLFPLALLAGFTASAFAAVDPGLLALAPPDAVVLTGLNVDQAKMSIYGLYMLSQMQVDDAGFQKFIADTGFDPRRDLRQILSATSGSGDTSQTVILGRGSFDAAKISAASQAEGATKTNYKGLDLIVHSGTDMTGAIAFLDSTTAVMGHLDAVKGVIDRRGLTATGLSDSITTRIKTLASTNDAWFLSAVSPASFFSGKINDPKVGPVLEAGMMQSIVAGSGGLKFSANGAAIMAQAVARSEKDASALADVVRFFVSLVQSNRASNAQVDQFATVLQNMQINVDGTYLNLLLTIPEATLEQMFMGRHTSAGKVAAVHN